MSTTQPARAQAIVELGQCPKCGYDVAGLPAEHACPECGSEYDRSVFILTVSSRRKRLFLAEGIAYTIATVMLLVGLATPMGGASCGMWIVACLVIAMAGNAYRRWLRHRYGGDTRLLITRAGIGFLASTGRCDFRPWTRLRSVRFRHHLWWLCGAGARIRRRLSSHERTVWRLHLRPRGLLVSQSHVIDVNGNWSRREAALIRNALRRRIRATRRR